MSTPGDATTAIPSCVPLNLLHSGGQAITADQIGGLGYVGTTRTLIQLIAAQFNTSGELFKLLADRPVGLAAGYEFRREYGANIPDPVAAAGDSTDLNFVTTAGGFSVNEGYGELSIPIVNHIPYVENLEGSAAMRVSDYSNFGTTTNYKLGARWSIFPDITLRGTYSTAFRAPSIGELFLGASDNFPFAVDPCAGVDPITGNPKPVDPNSTVGLKTRNGGNAALQPETAKIFTAGVVLEPRWVKNLSITLDYWNFAIDGDILNRGAGVILNGCLNGKVPAFCSLIHRDATGLVTSIDDLNTNVGNDRVDGIDLALRYTLPTQVGRFVLVFDGTWLNKFDRILADGEVVHGKGTYDLAVNSGGIGGANPEYRFNTGVAWGFGGLGAGVTMRYIGTYKECADISGANSSSGACYISPTLSHRIDAYNTWDAFLAYNFRTTAGKTSFAVGVHNLFDAAPPVMYNSFTPTADPTVYDLVGRFFYVRAAQNF